MHEYVIIGGGIVGLATAMAVGKKYPKARIASDRWFSGTCFDEC